MDQSQLSYSQRERLAYIEFRLYFMGEVRRAELGLRFGTASAAATRDLALYKELAPENLTLDGSSKTYRIGTNFLPLFDHSLERVLSSLSQGFGDGIGGQIRPMLPCEVPLILNRPNVNILAAVSRAIYQKRPLFIEYSSLSGGLGQREIVPLALVDSGLRWHVRAFDRKRRVFTDFVLTRMSAATVLENGDVAEQELSQQDAQWTRIVNLALVPHPAQEHPEIIAMDFGMVDGVLNVRTRAAVAGYLLRRWFVNCSPSHSIDDKACHLWLRDHLVLYGVESAMLAPGYVKTITA